MFNVFFFFSPLTAFSFKIFAATIEALTILASKLPHAIERGLRAAFPQENEIVEVINVSQFHQSIRVTISVIHGHNFFIHRFWSGLFLQIGTDLDTFVQDKRASARVPVQPYLIAMRGTLTSDILKTFLVLDGNVLDLGKVPIIRCFDMLFKSFFVFNVHFPQSWFQFFRFLQTCLYNFFCAENDDVPASSAELYAQVMSL